MKRKTIRNVVFVSIMACMVGGLVMTGLIPDIPEFKWVRMASFGGAILCLALGQYVLYLDKKERKEMEENKFQRVTRVRKQVSNKVKQVS